MPTVSVLDSAMHYEDHGSGVPVVFLHGNPTSSHLWRHVLSAWSRPGRLLAPDLIGMGRSGKPPIDYRFDDHARYLDGWFDALELRDVVLVGHDWGGALAFDWAARHPDRARAVAFLETIVRPLSWSDFPESARGFFKALRTPGSGEAIVLEKNAFIETALPATVEGGLSEADLDVYRAPYPTAASRRPLLEWPRAMPLDGEPADVVARVDAYGEWLAGSDTVPKLLIAFTPGPGTMIGPDLVAWCEANVAGLEVRDGGRAGHHAPEDSPQALADHIGAWTDAHGLLVEPAGALAV